MVYCLTDCNAHMVLFPHNKQHLSPSFRPAKSTLGYEYTVYQDSEDIVFEPRDALEQSLLMADAIEECISDLNLEVKNSKMRKNDWSSSLRR